MESYEEDETEKSSDDRITRKEETITGEEDELSVERKRESGKRLSNVSLVARLYGAQAASWCPADKRLCVQT